MTNLNALFDRYYDIAMKIHSICFDKGYTREDAKLYTYVYIKISESLDGVDYFEGDCSLDIEALRSMLGLDTLDIKPITKENIKEAPRQLLNAYKSALAKALDTMDQRITTENGFENLIKGELYNRLKFHVDSEYRRKHLGIFIDEILSSILEYTEDKVKISCLNYQVKLAREDNDLNSMLSD